MMTVEELREWMQRHGLNYDKAADMLGMPRRTFARLLSGEKEIDLCIAHACANIDAGRCPLGNWPELLKSAGGKSSRPTKRAATNNYVFDVACKGKKDEGQPSYTERVTVALDSGSPGGDAGEFEAYMRECIATWFEGAKVTFVQK